MIRDREPFFGIVSVPDEQAAFVKLYPQNFAVDTAHKGPFKRPSRCRTSRLKILTRKQPPCYEGSTTDYDEL